MCDMMLNGVVTAVSCGQLLVQCSESCQEYAVLVNSSCAFSVGDCVEIRYNGAMTRSDPPQITPSCIRVVDCNNGGNGCGCGNGCNNGCGCNGNGGNGCSNGCGCM